MRRDKEQLQKHTVYLFVLLVGECEINSSVLDILSFPTRYSSGEIKFIVDIWHLGESQR